MASGFKVHGDDLDIIFAARTSAKRADVGYKVGGTDISNRYEASAGDGSPDADQIDFDTHYKYSGTDLRYYFKNIGLLQWTLTVTDGSGGGLQDQGYVYVIVADSPPANKHWSNWSSAQSPAYVDGTSSSDSTAHVTITEDTTVVANFAWDQYTLTVTYGSGDGTFDYNASMAISADAAPSYQHFETWTTPVGSLTYDSATSASTNAHFAAAGNATAEATYAWNDYTITVQGDSGINSTTPSLGTHSYQYPDFPVTVSATPKWDYDFAHWELDSVNVGGSESGYNITSVGDHTIKATTQIKNVAFVITSMGNGSASSTTSSPCPVHTVVTVNTTPDSNYHFDHLEADNSGSVSGNTCQLEGLGTTYIDVYFALDQYTLTITFGSGGGLADYGHTYNIVADTYDGYVFTYWRVVSGSPSFGSSTDPTTTCTIGAGNANIEAMYDPI